jgi:hypothetical protein
MLYKTTNWTRIGPSSAPKPKTRLPAGRCSWKSCRFKNPSRRAAHSAQQVAQQVNKKVTFLFPRYGAHRFPLSVLNDQSFTVFGKAKRLRKLPRL